jgi:hypothetical protein
VVVDLANAGHATLAHKRKCARGEFPWVHTHGCTPMGARRVIP